MNGIDVEIIPTTNQWDAPVLVTQAEDGTILLARGARRYSNAMGPRRHVAYYPHAVVVVDGEMTIFDRERQPAANDADLLTILLPKHPEGPGDPTIIGLRAVGKLGRVVVDATSCHSILPAFIDELVHVLSEHEATSMTMVNWPSTTAEAAVGVAMHKWGLPHGWANFGEGDRD